MSRDDFLLVGKIIGVHGIKGALKVFSYCESAAVFQKDAFIYIKKDTVSMEKYKISNSNAYKNILRLSVDNISDIDSASVLTGFEIFKKKDEFEKLEDGTYYWFELIGMSVFTDDGSFLGIIKSVLQTGANDVLVIKNNHEETLVPAIESVIISVDKKEDKMIINLPEGLI
jgi:16S rRNA processing protein RimM